MTFIGDHQYKLYAGFLRGPACTVIWMYTVIYINDFECFEFHKRSINAYCMEHTLINNIIIFYPLYTLITVSICRFR